MARRNHALPSRLSPFLTLRIITITIFAQSLTKGEPLEEANLLLNITSSLEENNQQHLFPPRGLRPNRGVDLRKKPFTLPSNRGGVVRRRCQYINGTLWPSATMCEDELGSVACESIFSQGEPRSLLCHNPAMADLVRRCAKTCRVCCELDKFQSCKDSAAGLIDCTQHRPKCYDPAWYKVMMATCEQTCGFCGADRCFDAADGCNSLRALCNHPQFSSLMRHQCTKTCGRCSQSVDVNINNGATAFGTSDEDQIQIPFTSTLAPTVKPFVFTPATPIAATVPLTTTTPRPPKEIVVVVRPNPKVKKCYDKSATCASHKKLCDDWRYADLLEERCAKTCNFCDSEIPLVGIQEGGSSSIKSGEDRAAIRGVGRARRPDHGYFRRHSPWNRRGYRGQHGRDRESISDEEGASSSIEIQVDEREGRARFGTDETRRPAQLLHLMRQLNINGTHPPQAAPGRLEVSILEVVQIRRRAPSNEADANEGFNEVSGDRRWRRTLQNGETRHATDEPSLDDEAAAESSTGYTRTKLVVPPRVRLITPAAGSRVYRRKKKASSNSYYGYLSAQPARELIAEEEDEDNDPANLNIWQMAMQAQNLLKRQKKVEVEKPESNSTANKESEQGPRTLSESQSHDPSTPAVAMIGENTENFSIFASASFVSTTPLPNPSPAMSTQNFPTSTPLPLSSQQQLAGNVATWMTIFTPEIVSTTPAPDAPPDTPHPHSDEDEEMREELYKRKEKQRRRVQRKKFERKFLQAQQEHRQAIKNIKRGLTEVAEQSRSDDTDYLNDSEDEEEFAEEKRAFRPSATYGMNPYSYWSMRGTEAHKLDGQKYGNGNNFGQGSDNQLPLPLLDRGKRDATGGDPKIWPDVQASISNAQPWDYPGLQAEAETDMEHKPSASADDSTNEANEERIHPHPPTGYDKRRMIAEYPEQLLSSGTVSHHYGVTASTPTNNGSQWVSFLRRFSGKKEEGDPAAEPEDPNPKEPSTEQTYINYEPKSMSTEHLNSGDNHSENTEEEGDDSVPSNEPIESQLATTPLDMPTAVPDSTPKQNDGRGEGDEATFAWNREAKPFRGLMPVENKELEALRLIEELNKRLNFTRRNSTRFPKAIAAPSEEENALLDDGKDVSDTEAPVGEVEAEAEGRKGSATTSILDLIARKFDLLEGYPKTGVELSSSVETAKSSMTMVDAKVGSATTTSEDGEDPLEDYFQEFPEPNLSEESLPSQKLLVDGLAGRLSEDQLMPTTAIPEPSAGVNGQEVEYANAGVAPAIRANTGRGAQKRGKYQNAKRRQSSSSSKRRRMQMLSQLASALLYNSPRRPSITKTRGVPSGSVSLRRSASNVGIRNPKRSSRRFDGVLRDKQGKRFNKSQLNVRMAIQQIKRVYDYTSGDDKGSGSSASDLESRLEGEEGITSDELTSEEADQDNSVGIGRYAPRLRHRGGSKELGSSLRAGLNRKGYRTIVPRRRYARRKLRDDDDFSEGDPLTSFAVKSGSSSTSTDEGSSGGGGERAKLTLAGILSQERQITRELKAILHDLIKLKRSRYKNKEDEEHADLRRFLMERRNRRRKLALLRELYGEEGIGEINNNNNIERPFSSPDSTLVESGRAAVILLDDGGVEGGGRRRYDPVTGSFVYDAPTGAATAATGAAGPEFAAGPVNPGGSTTVSSLPALTGRLIRYGVGGQLLRGPVRYVDTPAYRLMAGLSPTVPNITPQQRLGLRPFFVTSQNRIVAGGSYDTVQESQQASALPSKTMTLRTTDGFTHLDVGGGFGTIPSELCKDYYPYCLQITPNGFCTSAFYPLKMKREFCPDSCNLC